MITVACFAQRTGLPSLAKDGIFGAKVLRRLPHSNCEKGRATG